MFGHIGPQNQTPREQTARQGHYVASLQLLLVLENQAPHNTQICICQLPRSYLKPETDGRRCKCTKLGRGRALVKQQALAI